MDIRLLGPIEASLDGRQVTLGSPQQRAVLAMLALEVNQTVSADRPRPHKRVRGTSSRS